MVIGYYKFDGSPLSYKDTIFILREGDINKITILNEQKRDTVFFVSVIDSSLYIGSDKGILSHVFNQKKAAISNINSSFFSPYLSKNSILNNVKEYDINNKKLTIFCFLENILDEDVPKGYSYYLFNIGFIAYINSRGEYYSIVEKINNSPTLNEQELKVMTNLLIKDSLFFMNRKVVPPLPDEYK